VSQKASAVLSSTRGRLFSLTDGVCIKSLTFLGKPGNSWTADVASSDIDARPNGLNEKYGTYLHATRSLLERRAFVSKSRMPHSEYIMNIFYIIGVVVVVIFVAGFLGVHL
jgi:hypothetical protein